MKLLPIPLPGAIAPAFFPGALGGGEQPDSRTLGWFIDSAKRAAPGVRAERNNALAARRRLITR